MTIRIRVAMLLSVGLLSLASATHAQPAPSTDALARQIEGALPKWDDRVLAAKGGTDWTARSDMREIAKRLDVTLVDADKMPAQSQRAPLKNGELRFDPERGFVRLVDQDRGWKFERDAQRKAVADDVARRTTLAALERLGIPKAEIGELQLNTQMAVGTKAGARKAADVMEMYRWVGVPRRVNDLPVLLSDARVVINNDGQLQRLRVTWPTFRLQAEVALLDRKAVVERALTAFRAEGIDQAKEIRAQLVYAPSGDDEATSFVPAILLSALADPTPVQVVVPVADLAPRSD